MKNATTTPASATDIFNGDWELQIFPAPRLTPGFKLEPSFLREFSAFLGRASPLPAAQAICKISSTYNKLSYPIRSENP
ncbi:MAG: hypothetical protein LBB26_00195 [Puniceicoccales bacterium]|nr:hypothetical protein [Puniceicoccales bacterium]